jgi:hypothetical protein
VNGFRWRIYGIDPWKPKDGYGGSMDRFRWRIYGTDSRNPKDRIRIYYRMYIGESSE